MTKQKAPKAQADALAWVEQALQDFGIAGISLRDLIDLLKVGLKSTNASVRASATKTLVTLKIFVGPSKADLAELACFMRLLTSHLTFHQASVTLFRI